MCMAFALCRVSRSHLRVRGSHRRAFASITNTVDQDSRQQQPTEPKQQQQKRQPQKQKRQQREEGAYPGQQVAGGPVWLRSEVDPSILDQKQQYLGHGASGCTCTIDYKGGRAVLKEAWEYPYDKKGASQVLLRRCDECGVRCVSFML